MLGSYESIRWYIPVLGYKIYVFKEKSSMTQAWIIDAVRTPRGKGRKAANGKPGGALSTVHPQELLATCLRALAQRNPFPTQDVEDVVAGCVSQAGDQGADIARMATLLAGWPHQTPGVTLNRFCGSGLQAFNFATMGVLSGMQNLVVGGGVESMSRQPLWSDGAGLAGNNPQLLKVQPMAPQGISADLIATLEGFSRDDLDAFAVESQRKAGVAIQEKRFQQSLVPVKNQAGKVLLSQDEFPRPDTSMASLAGLNPSFEKLGADSPNNGKSYDGLAKQLYPEIERVNHVHHAGNSSGIVDGAAAILVASDSYAKAQGLKPRAKVRSVAQVGSEPFIMLTAPTPASRLALRKAGMQAKDIDLWEINEAFACVPMKTMHDLEIDSARVNVNGGAIALGHPIGATGAMLVGTAVDEMERSDKSTALITLCIGGGMGVAAVIERVA